jgi:hypothetical protein
MRLATCMAAGIRRHETAADAAAHADASGEAQHELRSACLASFTQTLSNS